MQTFTFQQVQRGYWGESLLAKKITINAETSDAAHDAVMLRSDAWRQLKNGDTTSWRLIDSAA